MPSKYRPEIRNGLNWRKLLGYISIAENRPIIDITTDALTTYIEGRLDELQHQNPHTIFSKQEIEAELNKIRAYLKRST